MKIEAVEAARIPIVIARVGEIRGRCDVSGKGLSRFWNMPENFASQPTFGDRSEMSAVDALGMPTDDKDFIGLGIGFLHLFDHCTVNRMFENHDIPGLKRTQNQGNRRDDQIISLFIFG